MREVRADKSLASVVVKKKRKQMRTTMIFIHIFRYIYLNLRFIKYNESTVYYNDDYNDDPKIIRLFTPLRR